MKTEIEDQRSVEMDSRASNGRTI